MTIRAALLDWDGTLIDSGPNVALARFAQVLKRHNIYLDEAARARASEAWGWHGTKFVAHVAGVREELAANLYHEWEMLDLVDPQPYVPGALDALRTVHARGIKTCIVSSRNRVSLGPWVKRESVFEAVVCITCGDDLEHKKPDPRVFVPSLTELMKHGIDSSQCVFVGDTAQDILAARAAGIRIVVVETGPYRVAHAKDHPVDECDVLPSLAYFPEWLSRQAG